MPEIYSIIAPASMAEGACSDMARTIVHASAPIAVGWRAHWWVLFPYAKLRNLHEMAMQQPCSLPWHRLLHDALTTVARRWPAGVMLKMRQLKQPLVARDENRGIWVRVGAPSFNLPRQRLWCFVFPTELGALSGPLAAGPAQRQRCVVHARASSRERRNERRATAPFIVDTGDNVAWRRVHGDYNIVHLVSSDRDFGHSRTMENYIVGTSWRWLAACPYRLATVWQGDSVSQRCDKDVKHLLFDSIGDPPDEPCLYISRMTRHLRRHSRNTLVSSVLEASSSDSSPSSLCDEGSSQMEAPETTHLMMLSGDALHTIAQFYGPICPLDKWMGCWLQASVSTRQIVDREHMACNRNTHANFTKMWQDVRANLAKGGGGDAKFVEMPIDNCLRNYNMQATSSAETTGRCCPTEYWPHVVAQAPSGSDLTEDHGLAFTLCKKLRVTWFNAQIIARRLATHDVAVMLSENAGVGIVVLSPTPRQWCCFDLATSRYVQANFEGPDLSGAVREACLALMCPAHWEYAFARTIHISTELSGRQLTRIVRATCQELSDETLMSREILSLLADPSNIKCIFDLRTMMAATATTILRRIISRSPRTVSSAAANELEPSRLVRSAERTISGVT